jgi:hypothetical protein
MATKEPLIKLPEFDFETAMIAEKELIGPVLG